MADINVHPDDRRLIVRRSWWSKRVRCNNGTIKCGVVAGEGAALLYEVLMQALRGYSDLEYKLLHPQDRHASNWQHEHLATAVLICYGMAEIHVDSAPVDVVGHQY